MQEEIINEIRKVKTGEMTPLAKVHEKCLFKS